MQNIEETAIDRETAVAADPSGAAADRLAWKAPVLRVYDAASRTLGNSDQSTDGIINTHS